MHERQATALLNPSLRPPEEREERNAERGGQCQPSGPAEVGADQQRTDEADPSCEQQGAADEVKADTMLAWRSVNAEGLATFCVGDKKVCAGII
jgi:hypothetical protein